MIKIKDRIGLTLLEIIVAMLILSLVMYGLLSLFVASKHLVYHSGSRVVSMEVGKYFFEDDNLTVSADNLPDKNCLYNDSSCVAVNRTFNDIQYNVTYSTAGVMNATGVFTSLRKVVIDIEWVEPK
ncbi:MAG: type II secretion system protein [Candidatus Omnitrophota bacterium]